MHHPSRFRPAGVCLLGLLLVGCGPRRIALPTDTGSPLPDVAPIHQRISAACSGVRTMTAELGLSGRAGSQRLRGRVIAGFERPASMRLEGVAPFGPPAFILVARNGTATLLLPRESRVVRDAPPEDILGALTGVSLAPADLQAILTGCVMTAPRAVAGRLHAGGWASMDLDGGATLYLRQDQGEWRLRAAQRDGWVIEYPAWQGQFPQSVRLRSDAARVDLTAAISQIEANVDIDAEAFAVDVPDDALSITVEELRQSGPLRDQQ